MKEIQRDIYFLYLIVLLFMIAFGVHSCSQVAHASTYTLDQWADAIRLAEDNPNYGIISIPCEGEQCRQYCKNTVYNTLIKYRSTRCKPSDDDLTFQLVSFIGLSGLNLPSKNL